MTARARLEIAARNAAKRMLENHQDEASLLVDDRNPVKSYTASSDWLCRVGLTDPATGAATDFGWMVRSHLI